MELPDFQKLNEGLSAIREVLDVTFWDWCCLEAYQRQLLQRAKIMPSYFALAVERIGKRQALTLVVLILERQLRKPGSIHHPTKYFRSCVALAAEDALMVNRTIGALKHLPCSNPP